MRTFLMIFCASAGGLLLIASIWAGQTVYPSSSPPGFLASPRLSPLLSDTGVAIGAFLIVAALVQDILLFRCRRHGDFGENRNAPST